MQKHRSSTFVWCAIIALGAAGLSSAALAAETIYVAGQRVIVLRDAGPYGSVAERAAAVDKAITEVISSQDTQHPQVSVKKVDGLWSVFCGDIKVVTVYPPEAKANGVTEQSVAITWAAFLKKALPKATPPSKLGGTAAPKTPKAPVSAPPELPGAPDEGAAGSEAHGATTPVAAVPAGPAPTEIETPAPTTTIAAPTLLVRDAFDTIRKLPEEEYRGKRDEIVQHLIADLTPFITGQVPSSTTGPAVPHVPPSARGTAPVVDRSGPVAPSGGDTPPKPAVTGGAPKPSVIPGPAARNLPKTKSGDPNYAKVPQKNRIRTKLEMARKPFVALQQEDPGAAQPIGDMLAKARDAFWKGEYDEAEELADSALALLGLEYSE